MHLHPSDSALSDFFFQLIKLLFSVNSVTSSF